MTLTSSAGRPIVVGIWGSLEDAETVGLVVPAIATRARHYNAFARWAVGRGRTMITFDFSDYGQSLEAAGESSLAGVQADLFQWADDAQVVLDWVRSRMPEQAPLLWIGHSLGGQLLGLVDTAGVDEALLVATGVGSGWVSPWQTRLPGLLYFYGIAPLAIRLCGYYPGERLRFFGDLPGGVMRQWAHWARYRNYVLGAPPERAGDYAEVTTPITCISFTDDVVMSRTATRILLSFYRSAPRRHLRYSPEQLGAKAIGHMGPFRSRNEQIWEPLFGRFL